MELDSVSISVIVPVYNQWHLVPVLLDRLRAQVLPAEKFELLLVDNGSDVVPKPVETPFIMRQLFCSKPGSYAARNHGAVHARGDILVFTDADCRPLPEWLAGLRACLAETGDTIVAGGVPIVPRNPDAPSVAELYDMALGIPQALFVRRGYGVTANLAVPRAVFEDLGGFDSRRYSGGDAEFCRRAGRAGIGLIYCSAARVEHPARESVQELVQKVRRVKGGQIAAGPLPRRWVYAVRAFLPPVRAWRRALMAEKFTILQRLTVCGVQARLWLAEMAELVRLIIGKRPERQ